jgi:N-acetylmuramoyl-L-alanine amidase
VSRAERLRDEAVSRRLAAALLDAYRAEGLPVHENRPVRDHVVRGRGRKASAWVPAVLKGNDVPAKVLLETVNIGNPADAKILEDPAGRERIARAVVAGLIRFYSGAEMARTGARGAPGSRTGAAAAPAR